METKSILTQRVSFQKDTWSPIINEPTISEILETISGNSLKSTIEKLREQYNSDKESYKAEKLRLPAVTFCGTFDGLRQKEKLKTYNSLIVLDIDKLTNEELNRIKSALHEDAFAFAYWNSPSGLGLKGLVSLEFQFEINFQNRDDAHKSAFLKLRNYYQEKHNIELDNSGSDVPRLCFLSYDPAMIVKKDFEPFIINESDLKISILARKNIKEDKEIVTNQKDRLNNPKGRNRNHERQSIKYLIKYLRGRKISITSNYEDWYRVAYAIANTFTYELGERHYLELCEIDGERHDRTACIKMLQHCYDNNNGGIKYGTIEFLAKEKGYLNKNIGEGAFRSGA